MTVDDMLAFMRTQQYEDMMKSSLWLTMFAIVAGLLAALVFYKRSSHARRWDQDASTMLVATGLDYFIIQLLYVVSELTYRADSFRHDVHEIDNWVVATGPLVTLYTRWIVAILIAAIVLTRIVLLARWLEKRDIKNG